MASLARRTLGHRLAASQFVRPATPRASAYAYASVRYQSDDAPTNSSFSKAKPAQAIQSIQKTGLNDAPLMLDEGAGPARDWSKSYHGLSVEPFAKEVADILMETPGPEDVELKPDGIIYLPEIKYRRILNRAFGPGGWGLAPRGETIVTDKAVTREYALVCHGRLVAIARGEQDYYDPSGIPTATEGCKSNALMRCCKDLGIASELWDPRFIKDFKKKYGEEKFAEHAVTKKKKKLWVRKGEQVEYPWKATSGSGGYGN